MHAQRTGIAQEMASKGVQCMVHALYEVLVVHQCGTTYYYMHLDGDEVVTKPRSY